MAKNFEAKIHVTLKKSVLDPQGQTILQALSHQGLADIKSCRVGKFFEVQIESDSKEKAEEALKKAAQDILSNPVIEDFSVELQ